MESVYFSANAIFPPAVTGPGEVRSTAESRICVFCHTPPNAHSDTFFLWNRLDQTSNYMPYQSSIMRAFIGSPTGILNFCLGCHDGTTALEAVLSQKQDVPFLFVNLLPDDKSSYLGTGCSGDHPISFNYQSNIDQGDGEFANVSALPLKTWFNQRAYSRGKLHNY